jgi:hypothetical protein
MPRLRDDEFEGFHIFFFQPLEFADEHVPRMHQTELVTMSLDHYRALFPIHRAAKRRGVADLDVIVGLLFSKVVRNDKVREVVPIFFGRKQVNVLAQEVRIQKKLQRCGTKHRKEQCRLLGQQADQPVKLPPGGTVPVDVGDL